MHLVVFYQQTLILVHCPVCSHCLCASCRVLSTDSHSSSLSRVFTLPLCILSCFINRLSFLFIVPYVHIASVHLVVVYQHTLILVHCPVCSHCLCASCRVLSTDSHSCSLSRIFTLPLCILSWFINRLSFLFIVPYVHIASVHLVVFYQQTLILVHCPVCSHCLCASCRGLSTHSHSSSLSRMFTLPLCILSCFINRLSLLFIVPYVHIASVHLVVFYQQTLILVHCPVCSHCLCASCRCLSTYSHSCSLSRMFTLPLCILSCFINRLSFLFIVPYVHIASVHLVVFYQQTLILVHCPVCSHCLCASCRVLSTDSHSCSLSRMFTLPLCILSLFINRLSFLFIVPYVHIASVHLVVFYQHTLILVHCPVCSHCLYASCRGLSTDSHSCSLSRMLTLPLCILSWFINRLSF